MSKEVCLHPSSQGNFFRRLEQDLQSRKIVEAVRKGKSSEEIDKIVIDTKISMPPRRKKIILKNFSKMPISIGLGNILVL